jgi:hypothetical protein
MTDKDKLKNFLTGYPSKFIKTSTIIRWGCDNYCNRAARNSRNLCNEGFLKRLSRAEAILNGFTGREGIYEICGK